MLQLYNNLRRALLCNVPCFERWLCAPVSPVERVMGWAGLGWGFFSSDRCRAPSFGTQPVPPSCRKAPLWVWNKLAFRLLSAEKQQQSCLKRLSLWKGQWQEEPELSQMLCVCGLGWLHRVFLAVHQPCVRCLFSLSSWSINRLYLRN